MTIPDRVLHHAQGEAAVLKPATKLDIRLGDIVHLRVMVSEAPWSEGVMVTWASGKMGAFLVPLVDIVHVEPRRPVPLKVGERVWWMTDHFTVFGSVVAVDGEAAWVRRKNGVDCIKLLADLKRADG